MTPLARVLAAALQCAHAAPCCVCVEHITAAIREALAARDAEWERWLDDPVGPAPIMAEGPTP